MDDAQLPAPEILTDYDLLQAFLKLADKMFPGRWTRHSEEFTYFDYSERLKEVTAKREILEKRIADAKKEIPELEQALSKTTDENKIAALTGQRDEFHNAISAANLEIWQMGDPANMRPHIAGIARRKAVEERLISAIRKGAVRYWLFPSYMTPHDSDQWENKKGYGYNIELSVLRWPRKRYNLRRQSVRVYRALFDAWLAAEFPEKREPTLEEKATQHAVRYAEAAAQKVKKPDVVNELRAKFPDLTLREAERAWKRVPGELKLRGAPPKPRKK